MTEEPKVETTPVEESKAERNIADELARLGQQLADAVRSAWESEDRRKLQNEITTGVQRFGKEVTETLDKAAESERAKELRVKAERVIEDVRESDVVEEIRKGILTGLDVLNRELGKVLEKLETKPEKPSVTEPGVATMADEGPAPAAPTVGEPEEPSPLA